MKNRKMIDSWNKVEPDDAAQERMLDQILVDSGSLDKRRKTINWKEIASVAAACVVLLAGTYFYNNIDTRHLSNSPTHGEQIQDGKTDPSNQDSSPVTSVTNKPALEDVAGLTDEIKGLPVENFKLSEIKQLVEMDRIGFFNLLDLFKYDTDSFVIVKVAETRQESPTASEISEKQISTVKILETIWGDPVPEAINITQHLYGGCTGDEVTNLMRKDGVYLLPLVEDRGEYYLASDLDVLFEIDEEGHIWSHSDYTDFNRFDGRDYQTVTDEILRISQDDTLMLAASKFGMLLQGWKLYEATILSNRAEEKNEYGYAEEVYTAHVERSLSGDEPEAEITVRSYANEDLPLNKGERYLLFVDHHDEMHYINSNMIAGVAADGTIRNLGDDRSPFADFNGYTVDQMQELANKILQYLKTQDQ